MSQRKRILFFAEAVTLAHVTRPLVLAQSLDSARYDVHFACAEGFEFVFPEDSSISMWPLNSISSEQFIKALASGARFYDKKTLSAYIAEDISLIEKLKPDFVVGDFRLSLAVSSALCKTPYVALANAHWSPYSHKSYPLPTHFMTKLLGYTLTNFFFQMIRPIIFKYHALPHNQLRREHKLEPIGDLRQVYTYGDYTLYLDAPDLIPTNNLPDNHRFIGPLIWSPNIPLPDWFKSLDGSKKTIYVTLGSSGASEKIPLIVSALTKLDVNILIATADRSDIPAIENVYVANYLPGTEVIRKCDLVVCNGGSATAYQALAEGVPVLGIASNMDQYLTMSYIVKAGVGLLIRSEQAVDEIILENTARVLLGSSEYKTNTKKMKAVFHMLDSCKEFNLFVESI